MKFPCLILSSIIAGFTPWISAQNIHVEITNLTHGIYFTPLLIAAHDSESSLFDIGMAASPELQAMADGYTESVLDESHRFDAPIAQLTVTRIE